MGSVKYISTDKMTFSTVIDYIHAIDKMNTLIIDRQSRGLDCTKQLLAQKDVIGYLESYVADTTYITDLEDQEEGE